MATRFDKKGSSSSLKLKFAKWALIGASAFASYQYYLPNAPKDAVAKEVGKLTHSTIVGHFFGSGTPPWQTETVVAGEKAPAAPTQTATAAPVPGK